MVVGEGIMEMDIEEEFIIGVETLVRGIDNRQI